MTLIAGLLDHSGSMSTSKVATEDGWNELINEQRNQPGKCKVTLAQFDTEYELLYQWANIKDVPPFVLQPRGMTAMLDATGKFITEVGMYLSALPEDKRPNKVVCVIMTDGMENASMEWDWEQVKKLIEQQRADWNWEFMFLGANIDAVKVGASMGVPMASSIQYNSRSDHGTHAVYAAASNAVSGLRSGMPASMAMASAFTPDVRAETMKDDDEDEQSTS